MRWTTRLLALLLLSTALAATAFGWLALARTPSLKEGYRLGPADVARARTIVKSNDPRRAPRGAMRRIELNQADLNLAANYLLQNRFDDASARILLLPDRATLRASVRVPGVPWRPYLNLRVALADDGAKLVVRALTLGALDAPEQLARWLGERLWGLLANHPDYGVVTDAVQAIELARDRLAIDYRWQPEILSAVRQGLLAPEQQAAIAAYHALLVELQRGGAGRRGSLTRILPPLFALAGERSRARDPADENRALLLVLGAWASGRRLDALLPEDAAASPPPRFRLTLQGRHDFAQHYLISAALAANTDGALANAVGLFKEMSDIDRGSGFSFTDIAADRAGTRFGEAAVASAAHARRLQRKLAGAVGEGDLMPPFRDLPEHLSDTEFRTRYGGIGSAAYAEVMAEIERRLDAAPLLRD
ncbi:MAG: hypothetical protein P8106_08765 [Gammaproteobacteria bacterium]|jgi:hypothetical protein